MATRKRQADGQLQKPTVKKPANNATRTLHAFFSPLQTPADTAVVKEPAAAKPDTGFSKRSEPQNSGVALSKEQRKVLRMVVDDERNIFFTGSAGPFGDFWEPVFRIGLNTLQARANQCFSEKL